MKGTIAICCFRDLVLKKHGRASWEKVLELSGLPKDTVFLPTEKASDKVVMTVFNNVCKILNISAVQAAESFGEYWVNSFLPRLYPNFGILVTSSRDFIIKLNSIHAKISKTMKGMNPPRFKYMWKDENTLLITHESNLIFFAGLLKGVAKYYDEELAVSLWSSNQLMVKFPSADSGAFIPKEDFGRLEERHA